MVLNSDGNLIQIANHQIKINDLGLVLSEHPEWFPYKFEIRLDNKFLMQTPIEFGIVFTAFITDLEIMSMNNFDMKHYLDEENLQNVYQFTRKITYARRQAETE